MQQQVPVAPVAADEDHPHRNACHLQSVLLPLERSITAHAMPQGGSQFESGSRHRAPGDATLSLLARSASPRSGQGVLKDAEAGQAVSRRANALVLRLGLYTPPSSRTASSGRFVGGRPQTPARLRVATVIPRVPYPCLIPQGIQTAIPAARPRKGDVRLDVIEPRCG